MSRPYIGITGIVTVMDSIMFASLPEFAPGHRRMAGVLVSHKTLHGHPTTNRRYPTLETARQRVQELAEGGAWPTVHYNTRATGPLVDDLLRLAQEVPCVGGIQLNIPRPPLRDLEQFRERHPDIELILQVSEACLGESAIPEENYHAYVHRYRTVVEHALLDLSGGRGTSLREHLQLFGRVLEYWPCTEVLPGVAGGLGPGCAPVLQALRAAAPTLREGLSLDVESGVRMPVSDPLEGLPYQDQFSYSRALAYVEAVNAVKTAAC